MRRVIVVVGVLAALVLLAWWALVGDDGSRVAPGDAEPGAAGVAEGPGETRRARARAGDEKPAAPADDPTLSAFLRAWPEVGQDREQDPSLGRIVGRVVLAQGRPAPDESVVEATTGGRVLARARLRGTSAFDLRNVEPGLAVAVTARAAEYAPGAVERIAVHAGKTTDVGPIHLGLAISAGVDNRLEVEVAAGGKPVAGAQVTASTVFYGALLNLGPYEKEAGGTVLRATTDDAGRAVFDDLPPASYDVFVESEGHAFAVEPRQLVQRATTARVRFDLEPGTTIEGRAQDEAGQPVEGAYVVLLRWNTFTNVPPATTDAQGRFVARGLTPGNYFVVVAKDGMGAKDLQNVAAGTKDLVVTIPAGGELWVRCKDAATGAPVKAYTVRPFRKMPFAYLYAPLLRAESEDGTFRTRLLPASDYGAEIAADGYALANVASLKLSPPEPVEVALDPAGVVHGRVVAKGTGAPIVGAVVFVKRGGFPPGLAIKDLRTVTDAQGIFTIERLARRAVTLWISHVDHDEASFEAEPEPYAAGASPTPRTFELGSGGRVEGTVLGAGGVQLAETDVLLSAGFTFGGDRRATTDAQGRYAFVNVPPGAKYMVSVGATGGRGGRRRNDVVVTEGGTTVVDFVATGGQRVAGRTTRGEAPAEGVTVSIVPDDGGQFTGEERSKADGTFAFENVPPGKYLARARGAAAQTLVVKAEEAPAELVFAVSSASISIQVVDAATNQPLTGAWVDCEQVADGAGANLAALVRRSRGNGPVTPQGTFTFRGLEDGTYRVRAMRDGYGTEVCDDLVVANGASREGVVLALGPACTVAGSVRNAQSAPVDGAALSVRDARGRLLTVVSLTQSDGDGGFTQGGLRPGTYELTFEKEGYAPATRRVTVAAGVPERCDFVLLQGGRIELVVRTDGGKPVQGAVVVLYGADGRQVVQGITLQNLFSTNRARTDANGMVVIPGVAAGVYRVAVTPPWREEAVERAGVEVVEGSVAPVEVVVPSQS